MNAAEMLCSGTPFGFGGLSNEQELVQSCPEDFKRGNRWTEIAYFTFVEGTKKTKLAFNTDDKALQTKQWDCFKALLHSFDIDHNLKIAVLGWMLSEWTIVVDTDAGVRN